MPEVCSYCSTTKHYEEEENQPTDDRPSAGRGATALRLVFDKTGMKWKGKLKRRGSG